MKFVEHIRHCNRYDLSDFVPFHVGEARVGYIRRAFSMELIRFGTLFHVFEDLVHLDPRLTTAEARTDAVGEALAKLSEEGLLPGSDGEMYSVMAKFNGESLFEIDRPYCTSFGIINRGFHLNGLVGRGAEAKMWIARRSMTKKRHPGLLDNMVAGGHPSGLSPQENLEKECAEEAGLSREQARRAVSVGPISYCMEVERGLRRHTFWCYDLELGEAELPTPTDGEVESFTLMAPEEIARQIEETDGFKYNSALVIIDWLLRTGRITPEHPDYLEIAQGLRGGVL